MTKLKGSGTIVIKNAMDHSFPKKCNQKTISYKKVLTNAKEKSFSKKNLYK